MERRLVDGVSILAPSRERALHQITQRARLQINVSILAPSRERALRYILLYYWSVRVFQSSPPLARGRYHRDIIFGRSNLRVSILAPSRERALPGNSGVTTANHDVSILAPSRERALLLAVLILPLPKLFQSSPPLARGRYVLPEGAGASLDGFNPRPLSREGATLSSKRARGQRQ